MEQDFLRRLQNMQTAFRENPHNEDLREALQNYFDDLRTQAHTQPQIGMLTREALSLLRRFRNAQPPSTAEPTAAVDLRQDRGRFYVLRKISKSHNSVPHSLFLSS